MINEFFGNKEPDLDSIIKAIKEKISRGKITTENFYEEVGIYFIKLQEQLDKMKLSDDDIERFENEIDKIWDEVTLKKINPLSTRIQSYSPEGIDRKNLPKD